jgi:anti-sigma regulatory factor (Ser/Thr protein kinase)
MPPVRGHGNYSVPSAWAGAMTVVCIALAAPVWRSLLDVLSGEWAGEDVLSLEATDPVAVPVARHHTRALLAEWGIEAGLRADVELTVSELVSNSVQAVTRHKLTQSPVGLRLLIQPGHLIVAVWDCAPQAPRYRKASSTRTHGRGLQVISEISRGWGYLHCPGGGKAVFALFEP